MCIVFLYQNNDTDGQYKLILAANRDEYMSRPAKPADFHPDYPDALCGLDMEPAVQGGTWLGVTKTGKFSALTNVLTPRQDMTKLPRGRLVMDYLVNDSTPLQYVQSLKEKNHRKYNLIAGDLDSDGKVRVAYHSNCDGKEPRLLKDDYIVVACTKLGGNWHKMQHGQEIFKQIVESAKSTNREALTDALLNSLLSDTTNLYPDSSVMEQADGLFSEKLAEKYCSIRITGVPDYGTRMQTVILVDKHDNISFTERSLISPDQVNPWTKKSYTFPKKNN